MAKLYFRYGAMNSAKTLNLLAVSHNYKSQGKKCLILKPDLDNRFSQSKIVSRSGLSEVCDILVKSPSDLLPILKGGDAIDCILVDEAQFLSESVVDTLRSIATNNNIPVICYGLRTDFQTKLFPGSKRLLELSDSIEEIKTTCVRCNRKAIFNMRINGGKAVKVGKQIELGSEDKYESVCPKCYFAMLGSA